ncbi:MAG: PaaI family thioesterase [Acidobacteria bacterium]|nr:MAG: PaaI family thioesterase [Acidobacteriota bacterium]
MTPYQKHIEDWLAGRVEGARVGTLVGFRLTGFQDGVVRMEMDAGPQHHNPMGTVHGGILCDLADAAMGTAMAATLEEGESFTTLQLAASYLRAVREGKLVVTARIVHRGKSVGHAEAEIVDGEGRAVARLTSVCMVLRRG